jgi:hypothetical protein
VLRARFLVPALVALGFSLAGCEDETDYPPDYPGSPGSVEGDGDEYADTDASALTDFRATLDPHGAWVDDPTYGTVWVPNAAEVGADFAPYETHGHWAWDDDDEYVWVSDFDWGWAPFHYGRWVWIDGRGWAWIPGRAYAGAWVEWRYGYGDWDYVGWGPAPPFWIWRFGVAVPIGFVPPHRYWFCGRHELFVPGLPAHVVPGDRSRAIADHTRVYVPASPVASHGHVVFHGPPPATLGIDVAHVPRASAADRGVAFARVFAHPATATAHGGHAPSIPAYYGGRRGGSRGGHFGGGHFSAGHAGGGGHHGGGHR